MNFVKLTLLNMAFNKKTAQEAGKKSSRKNIPNKTTNEIRQGLRYLLEANIDTLQADLDQLEPAQKVKAILDLSKLVLPPLPLLNPDEAPEEPRQVTIVRQEVRSKADLE